MDFPGCPVVKTAFPLQGAGFDPWSLIWELRSHMLCGHGGGRGEDLLGSP